MKVVYLGLGIVMLFGCILLVDCLVGWCCGVDVYLFKFVEMEEVELVFMVLVKCG